MEAVSSSSWADIFGGILRRTQYTQSDQLMDCINDILGAVQLHVRCYLADEEQTVVLFEAPHRTPAVLAALAGAFGDERPAAVCRELTKIHEEVRRGTLAELAAWADEGVRGEVTIVVAGASGAATVASDAESLRAAVALDEAGGVSRKDAIRAVADRAGVPKRMVYDAVHGVGEGA